MKASDRLSSFIEHLRFEFWKLRDRIKNRIRKSAHRQQVFSSIYSNGGWDEATKSGHGSTLENTEVLRRKLPALWRRYDICSLLDAACGDFHWMKHLVDELDRYVGVDIVEEMIDRNREKYGRESVSFLCADVTTAPLPRTDAVFCRDCFIHLPTRHIFMALRNFKASGARFLLASSGKTVDEYHDIPVGSVRRINLRRPPFAFPQPLDTIDENPRTGRQLCLWNLHTLPSRPLE